MKLLELKIRRIHPTRPLIKHYLRENLPSHLMYHGIQCVKSDHPMKAIYKLVFGGLIRVHMSCSRCNKTCLFGLLIFNPSEFVGDVVPSTSAKVTYSYWCYRQEFIDVVRDIAREIYLDLDV